VRGEVFGEYLQAHHLLQRPVDRGGRFLEGEQDLAGFVGDLAELDPQDLVELFGVRRAVGCLGGIWCCSTRRAVRWLEVVVARRNVCRWAAKKCSPSWRFPLSVNFPGDEMGIAARD
jgi:hypothetical protein